MTQLLSRSQSYYHSQQSTAHEGSSGMNITIQVKWEIIMIKQGLRRKKILQKH